MTTMTNVDAPKAVQEWVSDWNQRWRSLSITVNVRLPEEPGPNKAVATLEGSTHVASITVWGTGTIEFILLNVSTQSEVVISDKEYSTAEELRSLLEECASTFNTFVRAPT